MKISDRALQWFGWYGTAVILVAYTLASFNVIEFENPWVALVNGSGCLGVAVASWRRNAYQAAVINLFLVFVAIAVIVRAFV